MLREVRQLTPRHLLWGCKSPQNVWFHCVCPWSWLKLREMGSGSLRDGGRIVFHGRVCWSDGSGGVTSLGGCWGLWDRNIAVRASLCGPPAEGQTQAFPLCFEPYTFLLCPLWCPLVFATWQTGWHLNVHCVLGYCLLSFFPPPPSLPLHLFWVVLPPKIRLHSFTPDHSNTA